MAFRLAAALLLLAVPVWPDIFIVRHGEKLDPKNDASLLSKAGRRRAEDLKRTLRSTALTAVYCTEYERTRQTAAPAAEASGVTPTVIRSDDAEGLAKALLSRPRSEDVLVVGHTDTIPELLSLLGVKAKMAIAEGDFDNLFIVSPSTSGSATMRRLHYGASR